MNTVILFVTTIVKPQNRTCYHSHEIRGLISGSGTSALFQALEVELLEKFSDHESIARFCGAFRKEEHAEWSVSQELWIALELCPFGSAAR